MSIRSSLRLQLLCLVSLLPACLCSLTLRRISIASATLSPPFASTTLAYTASLPQTVSAIDLTLESSSPTSFISVRINDGPFIHCDSAQTRTLAVSPGVNNIFITNSRDDGYGGLTYIITALNGGRIVSGNDSESSVRLISLQLPHFVLSPSFSGDHLTYTAESVVGGAHTHSLTVLPFAPKNAANPVAVYASLNGDLMYPLRSGTSSGRMALRKGTNVLFVQATALAADASIVRTYSILIKRSTQSAPVQRDRRSIEFIGGSAESGVGVGAVSTRLSALTTSAGLIKPQFDSETTQYTLRVDFHVPIIQFTAVPKDSASSMTLYYPATTASSSSLFSLPLTASRPSPFIPLAEGANVITISVGSKVDTALRTTYTINVEREHKELELAADDGHGHLHQHTPTDTVDSAQIRNVTPSAVGTSKYRFSAPFNHIAKRSTSPHDDPIVVGLYGQRYSVHVEPGFVYNLLTSPHVQLNARYIDSADIGGPRHRHR